MIERREFTIDGRAVVEHWVVKPLSDWLDIELVVRALSSSRCKPPTSALIAPLC